MEKPNKCHLEFKIYYQNKTPRSLKKLHIVQYNCRGYKTDDEFTNVPLVHADIFLNETWTFKASQELDPRRDGNTVTATSYDAYHYYALIDTVGIRGHGGVAILVKQELKLISIGDTGSPRIVAGALHGFLIEILLIAAYLPTGTTADKIMEY